MSDAAVPQEPKAPARTYVLLPHGSEPRLLLLPADSGWSLPHCESEEPFEGRIGPLVQALRDRLGAEVVVLRGVESPENAALYLLENMRPGWTPPEGRWVSREELPSLRLAIPEHRGQIERWFAEVERGAPAMRNEWERPGWFAEARAWIQDQLPRLGLTATGPVEQYRTVSISCLLTVPTSEGALYMKAMIPIFRHESALIAALSDLYPGHVPQVLAAHPPRGWFLMREFSGQKLYDVEPIEPWEETMRLLARMQIEGCRRADWLLSLGCHDRRLDRLAVQIDPLFADTAALTTGEKALTPAQIEQLRALAPRLKQLCGEMAAGPVPQTLVHGDLHCGNIVVSDGQVLIYDWTDGCLAYPFIDLLTLISPDGRPHIPDAYPRLRAAYLEPWMDFAPMEELVRLFDQAQILAELHQAVSYQGIVANVEAKEEWAPSVPKYLRSLLRRMEAVPEAH